MPKVQPITQEQRELRKIYDFILTESKRQRIFQKHIAASLGISQQAYSKRLQQMNLTTPQLVTVLLRLGATLCIQSDLTQKI